MNAVLVFVGGGIGALSRDLVGVAAARLWGPEFPFGTLVANLAGLFLIGLFFGLADRHSFFPRLAASVLRHRLPGRTHHLLQLRLGDGGALVRRPAGSRPGQHPLLNNLCGLGMWLGRSL